ncbi:MAG: hypothetical protein WDO69_22660 [Pseudomonadota bacterium]
MVKARTWFTLIIISLCTVAATASCGSDEATGGSGGGGIIAGGGRAGTVGRAGSGGGSATTPIGTKCTSDAQCTAGLTCAKANTTSLGDGGPSFGMCTKSCDPTQLDPTLDECGPIETGSGCVNFGTSTSPLGFCMEGCTQGDPTDVTTKCQGRSDFVCADLGSDAPAPFCIPWCRSDAECGTGLFCNKGSGLCSKTKPTGDPVGTICTPGATTPTCEGACLRTTDDGVTPVLGVCAELCSAGTECMISGTTPGGFCAGPLSNPFGAIDVGYCLPNCACTSDCKFPGDLCRKWADDESDLAMLTGAEGLCYPNVTMSVELTCGEAGAGPVASAGAGGDSAGGAAGASDGPGSGGVAGGTD